MERSCFSVTPNITKIISFVNYDQEKITVKQLDEIFQNWSDNLEDSPEVLAAWKAIEIELELLQNDKMQDLIFAYSTALQKEAFCTGYKRGMCLIIEIIED